MKSGFVSLVGLPNAGKSTLLNRVVGTKLAIVSDNEAFNRLYELVGQDRLAASLERAGIASARLVHRLDEFRSPEENRRFPRVDFVGQDFRFTLPERASAALEPLPPAPRIEVGEAYYAGGELVRRPMDFTEKNRIDLVDLQRGLCKLVDHFSPRRQGVRKYVPRIPSTGLVPTAVRILRQDVERWVPCDIGQPEVAPGVAIRQL